MSNINIEKKQTKKLDIFVFFCTSHSGFKVFFNTPGLYSNNNTLL